MIGVAGGTDVRRGSGPLFETGAPLICAPGSLVSGVLGGCFKGKAGGRVPAGGNGGGPGGAGAAGGDKSVSSGESVGGAFATDERVTNWRSAGAFFSDEGGGMAGG